MKTCGLMWLSSLLVVAPVLCGQEWVRQLPSSPLIVSMAGDAKGNCFVSGYLLSSPTGSNDLGETTLPLGDFIAKYDRHGNLSYARSTGARVLFESLGQRIIGVSSNRVFQLANEGTAKWTTELISPNVSITAISPLGGNAFVIAGYFADFLQIGKERVPRTGTTTNGAFVARIMANGKVQWLTALPGGSFTSLAGSRTGSSYLLTVDQLIENDVLQQPVFAVIAVNPRGSLAWTNRVSGDYTGIPYAIAADRKGNCFLAGHFFGVVSAPNGDTLNGRRHILVYSFAWNGHPTSAWTFNAGPGDFHFGIDITTDRAGNWFAGLAYLPDRDSGFDGLVLKNGETETAVRLGGNESDWIQKIAVGRDNALYVAAQCDSSPAQIGTTVVTNGGTFIANFKLR